MSIFINTASFDYNTRDTQLLVKKQKKYNINDYYNYIFFFALCNTTQIVVKIIVFYWKKTNILTQNYCKRNKK